MSPAEALTGLLNRVFALDKRMDAMAARTDASVYVVWKQGASLARSYLLPSGDWGEGSKNAKKFPTKEEAEKAAAAKGGKAAKMFSDW